jgi:hypothetical protein
MNVTPAPETPAMAHSFTLTVPGDLEAAVKRAERAVADAGGSFTGDATGGSFSGKTPMGAVKGTYTVAGNTVTVTITDKPWLLPAGTLEGKVREYFGAA